MKDIVVAIDFSKGSIHALEYAIELANLTHTNVSMVWVDNMSGNELTSVTESKEIRNEALGSFDELLEAYKDKLLHGKLTTKVRKGKIYQELTNHVKQSECCLMIIGTHGSSGFEEYWIGTNAFRIVSSIPTPIITVKYSYDLKRGFRKILLPIIHTTQTTQKIVFAADLAKATGADINLLAINTSGIKSVQRLVDNNVLKAEKYLDEKGVSYTVASMSGKNLAGDIIDHARLVDADLIVIMTDIQDQANSILLGPFAQQLVSHSPVPVLSMHPRDHNSL